MTPTAEQQALIDAAWIGNKPIRSLSKEELQVALINFIYPRARFNICFYCQGKFIAGLGNRRADAKFCCDEHRIRFNSLERSK